MTAARIIDRPAGGQAAFDRLLDAAPCLGPEHRWEGIFTCTDGGATGASFALAAQLGFHGPLVEGTGRIAGTNASLPDDQRQATLSGTRDGGSLRLAMWWSHPDAVREPFQCDGDLISDGRAIDGTWSVACFYPDTCQCGGSRGNFQLRRIEG